LGFWLFPLKEIIATEALWFQLAGAALLLFEANAETAGKGIGDVITEFRKHPRPPSTVAAKIVLWIVVLYTWLPLALGYLMVTVAILVKQNSLMHEVEWIISYIILLFVIWAIGRYFEKMQVNLRKRLLDKAADEEEEIFVRRGLRTAGFVLIAIATVFQLYPTLASG